MIIEVALLCATTVACFWIRAGHGADVDMLEAELEATNADLGETVTKVVALREELESVGRQLALTIQELNKLKAAASHGALKGAFGGK